MTLFQILMLVLFYKSSVNMEGSVLVTGDDGSVVQNIGFIGTILAINLVFFWNNILFARAI